MDSAGVFSAFTAIGTLALATAAFLEIRRSAELEARRLREQQTPRLFIGSLRVSVTTEQLGREDDFEVELQLHNSSRFPVLVRQMSLCRDDGEELIPVPMSVFVPPYQSVSAQERGIYLPPFGSDISTLEQVRIVRTMFEHGDSGQVWELTVGATRFFRGDNLLGMASLEIKSGMQDRLELVSTPSRASCS